jgi:TolB-like protein/DNA-binding winged helix-turn-helix (wHTH) protein/Flp pilus assembly protein TadD
MTDEVPINGIYRWLGLFVQKHHVKLPPMRESEQIDLAHASAFRLASLVIEPGLRQVIDAHSKAETLEPRVMQVLVVLAMANGSIVSRDDLVRQCWEGRIVGDDSINRVIGRLRRLAEEKGRGEFHIETITKVGYRLIGRIELIAGGQPAPLPTWSPPPGDSPTAAITEMPPPSAPLPELLSPASGAASPPTDPPGPKPAPPPVAASSRINRRVLIGGAAVAAVAAAGAVAWRNSLVEGSATGGPSSIAVLPFANLSGDPAQDYFSDGLSAEVRAELARNRQLEVTAQASSNKFRGSKDDAKTISSALGVDFLLDGNVRRSGDMVRVATELVDGKSGFSKWSQTFDRPLADVFAVQREIAAAIALALNAQMGTTDAGFGRGTATGGTTNIIAFDAFLQGKALFEQGIDEASDRAALARFDAAIAADPDYGQAHAARARTLTVIGNQYAEGAERRALFDTAFAAANRAVALAADSADAHSALGFVLFNGRLDARSAQAPYDRSYELGGGDADVIGRYALFCARIGRFDKARTAMARSGTLDRLNARIFRWKGEIEYSARRYEASIQPLERALELNPKLGVVRSALGASLLMLGKLEPARAAYAAEPNSLFGLTGLAIIDHRLGKTDDAKAAMARMIAEHGDNSLYQQAQVLTQWADLDNGMRALLLAQASGDAGVMYSRNDPLLDPLRARPEFRRQQSQLGFI